MTAKDETKTITNSGTDGNASEESKKENATNENTGKSKRGFASLTPEQRKEIAKKGGEAAHRLGVAHKFSAEEARTAGKKGGTAVSMDRSHMASIGRKGGKAAAKTKQ